MVQRPSYWGYWLFMTVLSLGSVLLLQDFTVSLLVLSILGSPFVLRRFVGTHRKAWIIPCSILVALLFSGLYYAADLIFFPHSLRAAHRLHDACVQGTLLGFFGLIAEALAPVQQPTTVLKHMI